MKIGSKLLTWITATADAPRSGWKCYAFAVITQLTLFATSSYVQGESEALWTILHVSGAFMVTVMGGRGPGYVAGTFAALSVDYHYIQPLRASLGSSVEIAFFVLTLLFINATLFLVSLLQRATKDALHSKRVADEAVRSRENALAVIAHDLRQPLSTLILQAELVKCAIDKGVEVDAAKKLRKSMATLQRMDRLIQDLLDSAKMDSGALCLSKEEVCLGSIVNTVVIDYSGQASQKAIQFHIRIPDEPLPTVKADKNRLIRVISNLVGNSVKFTPEGGLIEITLEMNDPEHEQFRISNSGPQVPPEQVPNLFKRNWQEMKTAHLGNGLGLYICQGIISAHQGSIWYEPSPDDKPSFCFRLPLS